MRQKQIPHSNTIEVGNTRVAFKRAPYVCEYLSKEVMVCSTSFYTSHSVLCLHECRISITKALVEELKNLPEREAKRVDDNIGHNGRNRHQILASPFTSSDPPCFPPSNFRRMKTDFSMRLRGKPRGFTPTPTPDTFPIEEGRIRRGSFARPPIPQQSASAWEWKLIEFSFCCQYDRCSRAGSING